MNRVLLAAILLSAAPVFAGSTERLHGFKKVRAIYVLNDAEIGNFSDEIVITATP